MTAGIRFVHPSLEEIYPKISENNLPLDIAVTMLESGWTPEQANQVLNAIMVDAMDRRAKYNNDWLGDYTEQQLEKAFEKHAEGLEDTPEGLQTFMERIYGIADEDSTGHPLQAVTEAQLDAIVNREEFYAGNDNYTDADTKKALENTAPDDFQPWVLRQERKMLVKGHRNNVIGQDRVRRVAVRFARKHFAKTWKTGLYQTGKNSTWYPYDWDGRKDVPKEELPDFFFETKAIQLEEFIQPKLEKLLSKLEGNKDSSAVKKLLSSIKYTVGRAKRYQKFYETYDQSKDPDLIKLQKFEMQVIKDLKNPKHITGIKPLMNTLQGILQNNIENDDLAEEIITIMSDLADQGINLAHAEYRINAKSIYAASNERYDSTNGKDGVKIDTSKNKTTFDSRYGAKIAKQLKKRKAKRFNMRDWAKAGTSVAAQMMTIGLLHQHDTHMTPEYRIADTQNAACLMLTEDFAREYGVNTFIGINGLFEEALGEKYLRKIQGVWNNCPQFIESTLAQDLSETYSPYVFVVMGIGGSDIQRQMGPHAWAFMEREAIRAMDVHAQTFAPRGVGLKIKVIQGHGKQRNFHPSSIDKYHRRLITERSLGYAEELDILDKLSHGLYKQGADAHMAERGSPRMTFISSAKRVHHAAYFNRTVAKQPYYQRKGETLEYHEEGRGYQKSRNDGLENKQTTAHNRRKKIRTGARPESRPEEGELPKLRAIDEAGANNTTDYAKSTLDSMNASIEETGDYFFDRMEDSSVFYELHVEPVEVCMLQANLGTRRNYATIMTPDFWNNRAREKPTEKELCRAIADHLEEMGDYVFLTKEAETSSRNFEDYVEKRKKAGRQDLLKDSAFHQSPTDEFHAVMVQAHRMAAQIKLFKLAAAILDPGQYDVSHKNLVHRVMRLDRSAIEELRDIYKASNQNVAVIEKYLEIAPSDYEMETNGSSLSYTAVHQQLDKMDGLINVIANQGARTVMHLQLESG